MKTKTDLPQGGFFGFVHKVLGTTPGEDVQPKEMISYSISGFGQNLICGIVGSFLMIFYTDAALMAPMAVTWIMLGTRLFDAFNDPIMGSIVDRTRTKWGKLRPYLFFTPIPIAILTVLAFTNFNLSTTNQIVYAVITYLIWGVLFTIIDVPYWGLSSAMTRDSQKRTNMLTIARLFCMAGAGAVSLFVPILTELSSKNLSSAMTLVRGDLLSVSYFWVALIIAILGAPMFLTGFFGTKERFDPSPNAPSLKHNLSLLFKNKPLLLVILSGVLGAARMIYMNMGLYYCKYNLQDGAFYSVVTLLVVPGGLLASFLTPWLAKHFGKRNTFIYSHIFGFIVLMVMFFFGKGQEGLPVFIVGLILLGIPSGFSNILTYAMIADSVDYLDYKTGERGEGICFSMQTFISKIGLAACSAGSMLILALVPYQPNNIAGQPQSVLDAIWLGTTLVAGISTLLTVLPLFFYNFNERKQSETVKRISYRNRLKEGSETQTDKASNAPQE